MRAMPLAAVLLVVLLPGCGGSSSAEIRELRLTSAGVGPDGVALRSSVCGYGTIWLPLRWSEVPEDTGELFLYIGQFRRERTAGSTRIEVPYASVIAGIGPERRAIPINTIPEEAEHGSFNPFSSCPREKKGQRFLFHLIAIDSGQRIEAAPLGRMGVTQLTEEALGIEDPVTSSAWGDRLAEATLASGGFTVTYAVR